MSQEVVFEALEHRGSVVFSVDGGSVSDFLFDEPVGLLIDSALKAFVGGSMMSVSGGGGKEAFPDRGKVETASAI